MKKIILGIVLSFSFTYAGLINAIAITVNDEPITLVDIDNKMAERRVNKDQAVAILVDELLYKQSLKKHAIGVDFFDVDNYIEQLAKQNKMSVFEFKSAVRQQQDYNQFTKDIRKRLKHQKLISTIASGKINRATDEDLKIYYNNTYTIHNTINFCNHFS
jgi:parvulin-like peptidyl-prolyl isomerase